jgi:hypothetical protein
MKNAPVNWDGRAAVGRTSTRFSHSAQGWSITTTLGYTSQKLKARCPANAGRREARLAGASASLFAPKFVFKCKYSLNSARKTVKVNKGKLRVFDTYPGGDWLKNENFPNEPIFKILKSLSINEKLKNARHSVSQNKPIFSPWYSCCHLCFALSQMVTPWQWLPSAMIAAIASRLCCVGAGGKDESGRHKAKIKEIKPFLNPFDPENKKSNRNQAESNQKIESHSPRASYPKPTCILLNPTCIQPSSSLIPGNPE